jgi:hypothetical protein
MPRGGAVALVLLGGLSVFGGIMTFVVSQFISGLPDLVEQVTRSIDNATRWLIDGPLHLSREQIDNAGDTAIAALRDNQERLTTGALSTAATLTEIIAGALLMLFTLIFLLYGGRNIYDFLTKIVPAHTRNRVRDAGRAGFGSLIGYVRATFLVALVDAVGIGAGDRRRCIAGDHDVQRTVGLFDQPGPAGAEVADSRLGEGVLEGVKRPPLGIDCISKRACGLATALGRQRVPVKRVVPDLRGVIEDRAGRFLDDIFER